MMPMHGFRRIKGTESVREAMVELADGNPGALSVMLRLFEKDGEGIINTIVRFDEIGLYGSDIWLAYKDVCMLDLDEMVQMVYHDHKALLASVMAAREDELPA